MVRSAVTAFHMANWYPLTWISHAATVSAAGLDPAAHHLVSLLIHAANAALLFLVLRAYTGALLPSALAAALFGVHPLHVEAVAWVAERKEVLAFLFWALALAAHRRHASRPGAARLALVAGTMALGLAAKATLVTLPFVLLLLDWWPLGRAGAGGRLEPRRVGALVAEKAPLFLLAAAGSVVTWLAQASYKTMAMLELSPGERLANVVVSYARYLGKTLWPARLAFFYPYPPSGWPAWAGVAAGLLVAGLTAGALLAWRRRPHLAVGWLLFLGTFVPMIGVVQIGWQSLADRYTYLPLTGLFLAAATEAARAVRARPRLAPAAGAAGALLVGVLALLSWRQAQTWRSSESVYRHAIAAGPGNWLALQNLSSVLTGRGMTAEALGLLQEAARIRPGHGNIWYNLGCVHQSRREYDQALVAYRRALAINPRDVDAMVNTGAIAYVSGRYEEALVWYRAALRVQPGHAAALKNVASTERMLGALRQR